MDLITVKQASHQLNRSESTIRKWLYYPDVRKEQRGRKWFVCLDSLREIAEQSPKREKPNQIKLQADLDGQTCPTCGGTDWIRSGYNVAKRSGTTSIVLSCKNIDCKRFWSLRIVPGSDLAAGLKLKPAPNYRRPTNRVSGEHWQDTPEKVKSDRESYVQEMTERGVPLSRILDVFAPDLGPEITSHYHKYS
mgnify:CR=1 FL=1|tara:strand:+ start:1698 stop:2273 length:576 start_codon:yes stop_codon:yes gene_type:complete